MYSIVCQAKIEEALKWFKPAKEQFQIFYKSRADQLEYQPDFVAETDRQIYMLRPAKRAASRH